MAEITEAEAAALARDTEGAIVAQESESDTHSSVCLKKFPSCYVLGASCEAIDTFKYYAFDSLGEARAEFDLLANVMRRTGTPFGALS